MALNDSVTDVQAETQTDVIAGLHLNTFDTIETVPDVFMLFRRNARPFIADRDARARLFHCNTNDDGAIPRRVLERICQIVMHHLPDTISVSDNKHSFAWPYQRDRAFGIDLALILNRLTYNRSQITWPHTQLQLIGLDAGDIQ